MPRQTRHFRNLLLQALSDCVSDKRKDGTIAANGMDEIEGTEDEYDYNPIFSTQMRP